MRFKKDLKCRVCWGKTVKATLEFVRILKKTGGRLYGEGEEKESDRVTGLRLPKILPSLPRGNLTAFE